VIMSGVRIDVARNTTTMPGMSKMFINEIVADLDPVRVFVEEYQVPANQYKVPPGASYFAVNYTLNTQYNSSCVEDCTTC
jgi:hypothetical protein